MKRLTLGLCLLLMGPLMACAEATSPAAAAFKEGVHYERLATPLRSRSTGKVEVMEFFSYGCGHCYNFEPMLGAWKKQLPEDVVFVRSPVAWSPPLEAMARAFYSAQALGMEEVMHKAMFDAMHRDRKQIGSQQDLANLFVAQGVSQADFDRAFNSFGVGSQVGQATSRMRSAKVTGTPELMVAGKYRITTRKAGSQANMLKIADYLIEQERSTN